MLPTNAPAIMTVEEADATDAPGCQQRGRRHLDGSPPGEGSYLTGVTVSLPESDVATLEEIGNGNRSAAVRLLLETWRENAEWQLAEQPDAGREHPTRQRLNGRHDPVAAVT